MASFNLKRFIKQPLKGLENAGRSAGKVVRQAAPFAGLIPGVGPGIGAAAGFLGSELEGRNFKDSLKSGAYGGLSGLANSTLLSGPGYKGIGAAIRGAAGRVGSAVKGGAGATGSTIADAAGRLAGGSDGGGFGFKDLLGLGLAGAGAYSGIKDAREARAREADLTGKELGIADETANYGRDMIARSRPLLEGGSAGLLARMQKGPRVTQSFSRFRDQSNPFAQQYS